MTVRPVAPSRPLGGPNAVAVACDGLTYRFGQHVAVDCLSMSIAGLALSRDRLMGIEQAITMPLFFSSNALYPERLMPGWLQAISEVNPLSYEVNALRGLLIGLPTQPPA